MIRGLHPTDPGAQEKQLLDVAQRESFIAAYRRERRGGITRGGLLQAVRRALRKPR